MVNMLSCVSTKEAVSVDIEPFASCLDPVDRPGSFADALPNSGIDFVHVARTPVFEEGVENEDPLEGAFGAGIVAADLDRDGFVDLFFPQEVGPNKLYWGKGNADFEEDTAENLTLNGERSLYGNTADYNGDGLLDLLVTGYQSIHLFENMGNRQFVDRAEELNLQDPLGYPGGAAWGDYDRDGDLDLFVGSYGLVGLESDSDFDGPGVAPSQLYRNEGTHFSDHSFELPVVAGKEGACLHASFRDLDDDGDLDLLQVNDFGPWLGMTQFWENVGLDGQRWVWVNRHASSGIGELAYPMGSLFRDLNGDGKAELWFSDIGQTRLFSPIGVWEWADMGAVWTSAVEDEPSDVSWSVVDIDLDGDGRIEVYINYGPHLGAEPPLEWGEVYAANQPDRLLFNDAPRGATPNYLLAEDVFPYPQTGNARGSAIADLDGNGVPDLVTSNIGATPAILLGQCTDAKRFVVELRDRSSGNYFGIGAKVTVETEEFMQVQELSAGGRGSFSGGEPQLFFGLDRAKQVERLTVEWPDGMKTVLEALCAHCKVILSRE